MKKLLSVFNTCGIKRTENVDHYKRAIHSFLDQDLDSHDLLVSACLNDDATKDALIKEFGSTISYNFVNEKLPVNATFNHSVITHVKQKGKYEGYFYIDSGCILEHDKSGLSKLYEVFKEDNFGMLSARTDTDTGYNFVFGVWGNDDRLFNDKLFYIPVGKAVNCHVMIFSNDLLDYYGKLIPDIFASYCTESVFSFLNAALKKKWGIYRDLIIPHVPMMDGQSAGFQPSEQVAKVGNYVDHPFRTESILKIMTHPDAIENGLGYEEVQRIVMHREDQYDEDGYCVNDKLRDYIRDNLYLPKDLLDYDAIKYEYI